MAVIFVPLAAAAKNKEREREVKLTDLFKKQKKINEENMPLSLLSK
jgi:hypothetical protein